VRRSEVDDLDSSLAEASGADKSLPQYFMERRATGDVVTHLYTRYGISKGAP
jgi:hypothetical protein